MDSFYIVTSVPPALLGRVGALSAQGRHKESKWLGLQVQGFVATDKSSISEKPRYQFVKVCVFYTNDKLLQNR